jgi:hypothetical protein
VFPPPGLNLKIPEGLTAEQYCKQIGGDCSEYADKFETIEELFTPKPKAKRSRRRTSPEPENMFEKLSLEETKPDEFENFGTVIS